MKLHALKFDTPNNAAISLDVLAEQVRRGERKIISLDLAGGVLSLQIAEPVQKRPELPR